MDTLALFGTILGLGFTAGINLYATVLVTGLGLRLGWIHAPPALVGLDVLTHPVILTFAGLLYVVEFVADKVPAVDHAWDLVHTFIRPGCAAWIAWAAIGDAGTDPLIDVLVVMLAGGVALSSHVAKASTRLGASVTGGHALGAGVALSLTEDVFAAVIAPAAFAWPRTTAIGVALALLAILIAVPFFIQRLWRAAQQSWTWIRGGVS